MERTLAEILRQLERKNKRKYCYWWSCGTNRTTTFVGIVKAVSLVLCLCLIYFSICFVLLDSSSELDLPDEVLDGGYDHRSPISGHYRDVQDAFRNISNTKFNPNTLDDGNGLRKGNPSRSPNVSHVDKLTLIFHKADRDQDGYLDGLELAKWINVKVKEHLTFALKDNFAKYFQLDTNPRNGIVTWEEYLTYFFKTQGVQSITAKDIRNKSPAYNKLPRDVKVELARVQARWYSAVSNSEDFLTVDEFLAFLHPEASPTQILHDVQDVFYTFDLDGDGVITKEEFDTTYREAEGVDKVYQKDKHLIDTDGNKKISRVELMRYMDPRNMHFAEKDANALLKVADTDKDGRLNLSEVLQKEDFIVKSKFYDVERNLHNLD